MRIVEKYKLVREYLTLTENNIAEKQSSYIKKITANVLPSEINGILSSVFDELAFYGRLDQAKARQFAERSSRLIYSLAKKEEFSATLKTAALTFLACVPLVTIPFVVYIHSAISNYFSRKKSLGILYPIPYRGRRSDQTERSFSSVDYVNASNPWYYYGVLYTNKSTTGDVVDASTPSSINRKEYKSQRHFGVISKVMDSIANATNNPTVVSKESLFNTKGEFRKYIHQVPKKQRVRCDRKEYGDMFIGTAEQINRMRIKILTEALEHLDGRPYHKYKIAEYRHARLFLTANNFPASKYDEKSYAGSSTYPKPEAEYNKTRLSVVKDVRNAFFISRERSKQSINNVISECKKSIAPRC